MNNTSVPLSVGINSMVVRECFDGEMVESRGKTSPVTKTRDGEERNEDGRLGSTAGLSRPLPRWRKTDGGRSHLCGSRTTYPLVCI